MINLLFEKHDYKTIDFTNQVYISIIPYLHFI